MSKKKLILMIVFFALVPFMFMTGKSSWIVVNDTISTVPNEYYPIKIDKEEEIITYDGKYHDYTYVMDDNVDSSKVTLKYYLCDDQYVPSNDEYEGKPINVGTYYTKMYYDFNNGAITTRQLIGTALLTIIPSPRIISINDHTITYGDESTTNGYVLTQLKNGEYVETPLLYNEKNGSTDTVDIKLVNSYIKWQNAGLYEGAITADLKNSTLNTNYSWSYEAADLTVNKKQLTFEWLGPNDFTYNGQAQSPELKVEGLYDRDSNIILVNGAGTLAGNHTVTLQNSYINYIFTETNQSKYSYDYKINQKPLEATWSSEVSFTYDKDLAQSPSVELSGIVQYSDGSSDEVYPTYEYYLINSDGTTTYKGTTAPTDAGDYRVDFVGISGEDAANYSFTASSIEFKINKKDIEVSWDNLETIYNNEIQLPTFDLDVYHTDDYTVTYTGECLGLVEYPIDVDIYTVVITTSNPNYNVTNTTETFTINQKTIDFNWNEENPVYTFNGANQCPTGALTGVYQADIASVSPEILGSARNASSTPYVATCSALTGDRARNYVFSATYSTNFTINPLSIDLLWSSDNTWVYDAKYHLPTAEINSTVYDEVALVITEEKKNAGTYTAMAVLSGDNTTNYTISNPTCGFDITAKELTVTASSYEIYYGDPLKDYTKDNVIEYQGFVEISDGIFEDVEVLNLSNISYTSNYNQYDNVGAYNIYVSGVENKEYQNYTFTYVQGTLTVSPKTITLGWNTNTDGYVYNGTKYGPTATAQSVKGDNLVFTFEYDDLIVGDRTATAALSGDDVKNYNMTNPTESYIITPRPVVEGVDITNIWSGNEFTYNGESQAPTITFNNIVSGEIITPVYEYYINNNWTSEIPVDAGNYQVKITDITGDTKDNYSFEDYTFSFEIKPLELTIAWSDLSQEYAGIELQPTVSFDGWDVDYSVQYNGSENLPIDAGSYEVTIVDNDYNFILNSTTNTFEITPIEISVTWTSESANDLANHSFEYIGAEVSPTPTANNVFDRDKDTLVIIVASGKYIDANANMTGTQLITGKSIYTATAELSGTSAKNYTLDSTKDCDYVITAAGMNANFTNLASRMISLGNFFTYNGQSQIPVAYIDTTLLKGRDIALADSIKPIVTPYYNGEATESIDAGDYTATITSINTTNYELLTNEEASYTISPIIIGISYDTMTKPYNGYSQTPNISITGVLDKDQSSVSLKYTISLNGEICEAIDVNTYDITCEALEGSRAHNYTIPEDSCSSIFNITKIALTITANDKVITYGDEATNNGVTYSGFVGNDSEAIFTDQVLSYYYADYIVGSDIGEYDITPSGLKAQNYEISYVSGKLIVNQKTIEFSWDNSTLTYNKEAQAPAINFTGIELTDGITLNIEGKQINAGTGYNATITSIDSTNAKAKNYILPTEGLIKEFEIKAKTVTLTWDTNTSFVFDGKNHAVSATINDVISGDTCLAVIIGSQRNVGTGYISVCSEVDNSNYVLDKTYSQEFEITPMEISLTWITQAFVYNSSIQSINLPTLPTLPDIGITVSIVITQDGKEVEFKNAGIYTVTATLEGELCGNYDLTNDSKDYSIVKATIEKPQENTNTFIYNGENQTYDLSLNDNYTIKDNVQKNAGTYTVTVSLNDTNNYSWTDGSTNVLEYTFKINKATYDMSGITFEGKTVIYTGGTHPLAITGELPTGVTVAYQNNNQTNVGTHTVTAVFTGDAENYNPIEDMTATLVINKATYDMSGITFEGKTVIYTGDTHPLAITGELPTGVTVSYQNNNQTNVGTHTVTAVFTGDGDNYNPINDMTATLVINKATPTNPKAEISAIYGDLLSSVKLPDGYTLTGYEAQELVGLVGQNTFNVIYNPDSNNYNDLNTTITINVSKKELTVSWNVGAYTYNGSQQGPTANLVGIVGNDNVSAIVTGLGTTAGNHTASVNSITGDTVDNYYVTASAQSYSIAKANYDMSNIEFNDQTYEYRNTAYSLQITGTLPNGVTVTYENNTKRNVGVYEVIAKFTGDTTNYNAIPNMTATLTIEKGTYDMSGITFEDTEVEFDGNSHSILISGTLPSGVTVSYENNEQSQIGTYEIIAKFLGSSNYNDIPDMTATLTIKDISQNIVTIIAKNTTVEYDGEKHYIDYDVYFGSTLVDKSQFTDYTITFWYTNANDASTGSTSTAPTNAGTYIVEMNFTKMNQDSEYQISDNSVKTATLTITPKKVKLIGTVQINYDSSRRTWALISSDILANLQIVESSTNNSIDITTVTVDGMHNGIYYYGTTITGLENTTNVVGSTYAATINLNNNNYELESNLQIVKYKTAIVNGVYYTIEDAILNTSGTISFEGNASSTSSYVLTSFTNLLKNQGNPYNQDTYYISGRTLLVPYQASLDNYEYYTSKSDRVYSTLLIPENITLEIINSGELVTGGAIKSGTKVTQRGIVMNNGNIIVESGSEILSYGFIKGKGEIILASGASATDCMYLPDWPGGQAAMSLVNNVFPSNAWSVHNISCNTKINAGALYKAYMYIYMNAPIFGDIHAETTVEIMGNNSSTACLFKPVDNNGYVYKYAKPADSWTTSSTEYNSLNTIVGLNQTKGQKDIVEIHGNYDDATLLVELKLIYTVKLQTSTSISCPLGYADVIVSSGSTLSLDSADYVFLPGTKLTVEEGATLNVSGDTNDKTDLTFATIEGIKTSSDGKVDYSAGDRDFYDNCIDKTDAILLVNGIVNSTGRIGGNVITEVENAILNISETTSTYQSMYATAPSHYTTQETANGIIDGVESTFESVPYSSTTTDGETYYWTKVDTYAEFKFEFYDGSVKIGQTSIIVVGSTSYTIKGNEYQYNKLHYDFTGWTYSDGSSPINDVISDSSTTTKLYANFDLHEYEFSYSAGYKEENTVTSVTPIYSNQITTFTIEDFDSNGKLSITTKADYDGMNFNGWYIGIDTSSGIKIDYINLTMLEAFVSEYGDSTAIPLYCEFTDEKYYTVTFDYDTSKYSDLSSTSIPDIPENNTIVLPKPTEYDDDTSKRYYFGGWFTQKDGQGIEYTDSTRINGENQSITLYAYWIEKRSITYSLGTQLNKELDVIKDFTTEVYYYIPNSNVLVYYQDQIQEIGHTFVGWTTSRVTNGSIEYSNDKDSITTSTFTGDITLYASYTAIKYSITIVENNSTTTVKDSNGNTIASGNSVPYGTIITYTASANSGYKDPSTTTDSNIKTVEGKNYVVGNATITTTTKEDGGCVAAGTLITLADGTQKKVEDILETDQILVFNHETGTYEAASIIFIERDGWAYYNVINLRFSDGRITRLIYEHGLFDLTLNKYVYIDESNYQNFIGHEFAVMSNDNNYEIVTLEEAYVTYEYTGCYSFVTVYHMNYFIDGLFSMPGGIDGIFNIFEYDKDTLKYNQEIMQADIEKYGLYTYEDFEDYLPYEVYLAFPAPYFKVAVGKGMITYEEILVMIERYLVKNGVV